MFNVQKCALTTLLSMGLVGSLAAAHAQMPESTLHTVLKRGHLIIGARSTTPGFGFKNEKGELTGLDIDLGREIARGLFKDPEKVRFEILPSGAERVPALLSGRVDAVIAQFSVYIERGAAIEFSVPYSNANGTFLVRANSPYQKNADLNGKPIATRQGADMEQIILKAVPQAKFQGYPDVSDALFGFRQGRAEAFYNDHAGQVFVMNKFPNQFRIILDSTNPLDRVNIPSESNRVTRSG